LTNFLKGGLAAAIFASTLAATPALANERTTDVAEVAVAAVEYSDLDLSTERGQARLHIRLRNAAQYVCGMDIRDAGTRLPRGRARRPGLAPLRAQRSNSAASSSSRIR